MRPCLPFDDRFFRAPHATVAPLVEAGARLARVPELGTILFLRQHDVAEILQDRRSPCGPSSGSRCG